jgi:TolA-binding protein
MKRGALLISLLLMGASCSRDLDVGRRYHAERELWRANWEFRNLSIRPQDVSDAQLAGLAQKFEGISERIMSAKGSGSRSATGDEVQTLAARALFAAAQVHAMLHDSTRVEQILSQVAQDFGHLPQVGGEVALAQGMIAENRGQLRQAADFYQAVVERLAPQPGDAGPAGMVLDLPLQIARLRARDKNATPDDAQTNYGLARAYYQRLLREHAGDVIGIESQVRLAQLAADLRDWDTAISALRDVESQVSAMDEPSRQPCEVRFAISGYQRLAGEDLEAVRRTLESILADYPKCKIAPQVLLALCANANSRDQVEEALGYLDRIIRDYRDDEQSAPEALLVRARLLASRDRWREALEILRALPSRHPMSEQALVAPLEIVQHYRGVEDAEATAGALEQAERDYRGFLAKYPPNRLTAFARQRLIDTLILQKKFDLAVTEYVSLADDLRGSPLGASLLVTAAEVARNDLANPARAAGILEHIAESYPKEEVGRWAAGEAARLRETTGQ